VCNLVGRDGDKEILRKKESREQDEVDDQELSTKADLVLLGSSSGSKLHRKQCL
jgi:hypothetical protein